VTLRIYAPGILQKHPHCIEGAYYLEKNHTMATTKRGGGKNERKSPLETGGATSHFRRTGTQEHTARDLKPEPAGGDLT